MQVGVNTQAGDRLAAGSFRDTVPFALAVACGGAFSFLSGGYILARSSPLAVGFLAAAAVWVWFAGRTSGGALFRVSIASFGLFVAWSGLSVAWSYGPDLSWVAFNLAAFYLALVAVLGLTPVRGLQLRVAGLGALAVCVATGVYAFLGKAAPDVVTHAHTYARLDSPVGYWNVLALMMVLGLAVALALAGDRQARPVWRVLAAAGAVPLCFTFFFTFSRGGWLVLAVALPIYFGLTNTRLASLFSLAAIAVPVAAVLWRLRSLETLFATSTDDALRAAQGHTLLRWALVALLVTAGAQALLTLGQRAVPWPRRLRVAAGAALLATLVVGVAGASWWYLAPRGGLGWVGDRVHVLLTDGDPGSAGDAAARLINLNTGRPPLWREALQQSRVERLHGTGAGTFPLTHYRFRESGGVVKHAHSQWLNVLSELGVAGLVLFVAALALLAAAAVGNPFSRRRDPMRPLLVALQAGMAAFLVHLTWDWTWDMAAIGTLFFLFAGACSSYLATGAADRRAAALAAVGPRGESAVSDAGGPPPDPAGDAAAAPPVPAPRRRASLPGRALASTALLGLALSWLPPYLELRATSDALAASGDGDTARALNSARGAARFDPLAVDPLIVESLVLQQEGRHREALATLGTAAALQPDNYEVYYQIGVLQGRVFGRKAAAVTALRRALALNPLDRQSRDELARLLGG
ncbi:MAG: O-antigen ligase family protein [Thermoleophilia bacterium]